MLHDEQILTLVAFASSNASNNFLGLSLGLNDANNHWFGLVILSSFSVVGLILATGVLVPVTNGLAMVSMVDID